MSLSNLRYASSRPWTDPMRPRFGRDAVRTGAVDDADLATVWTAVAIAGTGIGAYHGYMRNNSVGWAIGWGVLGAIFPIFVIPIAFAQGIDKRAK